MFFEHPDELRSSHYAALLTAASVGHQTAELQANILAVLAYDTQATGHALHESKGNQRKNAETTRQRLADGGWL